MTRKRAAQLYELYLKNAASGIKIEDIFSIYCDVTNPVERQKELEEFESLINEAKEHGQAGYEIINYLTAKRDTVEEISLDEKGNVTEAKRIEGDPVFDPSGKTDMSVLTGAPSSDFQFGDESTGGIEFLNPDELEIGDPSSFDGDDSKGITLDQLDELASRAINPNELDEYGIPGGEDKMVKQPEDETKYQMPAKGIDPQNKPSFGENSKPGTPDFQFGDESTSYRADGFNETSSPSSMDNFTDGNNTTFGNGEEPSGFGTK